ncbi:MAG: hypothetical protein KF716_18450 [Anaerolineae bacterium]|nr:hypothetical protein [Anaerolineae bacterium]
MTITSEFPPDATDIEQISPYMTRYWLFDHQIVVFKMTSVSREAVDVWIDTVKATMTAWSSDHPYLAIHDMTSEKTALTPYARARAEELLPLGTRTPGFAAIVLPGTFVGQVIRLFMRTQKNQGVHNEIFFTLQEAITWLTTKMSKDIPVEPDEMTITE